MAIFEVKDMTCGHCISTITKAVMAADPAAKVRVDLATHRVTIDATDVEEADLGNAIRWAGYTPVALSGVDGAAAKAPGARGAGCCGSGPAAPR